MNETLRAPARWQAIGFGLITLIACAGAFVGLSASGLWIDELFTVHLIHHHDGLREVFKRALTDTHPPLYYFFLYEWTRLTGLSEWALRLPSAVFAVLAIAIFAVGARRALSPAALAFTCAVASVSTFWFSQAQNARSYALSMALAASLLSVAIFFRRKVRAQSAFPVGSWLGLSALGLIASLTHAYLLLALGMVLLMLLLSLPSWRVRAALIVTGLVVLAFNVAYYRLLVHSSQQDLQNLWFSNNAGFFKRQIHEALSALMARQVLLAVALLAVFGIHRKMVGETYFVFDEDDTRWTTALAMTVLGGVIICGIAVSLLVAPSFSDRNLLTCVPFAWLLIGRLYDVAGPRGYTRGSVIIAVLVMLLVGTFLFRLPGRALPRTESWRPSAQYVAELPGCAGQTLPVVLPYRFGHDTPYFRALAERDFFGYYLPQGFKVQAYMPADLAARHPMAGLPQLLASRAVAADSGGCTQLAWGIHDLDESAALKVALDLARQPGIAPHRVLMQEFMSYQPRGLGWQKQPEGYVYLAVPAARPDAPVEPPITPQIKLAPANTVTLGDRVVVSYLTTHSDTGGAPYLVDVYSIQRWTGKAVREDFVAVHRLSCDTPVNKDNWDVWPDPTSPGCSHRPAPTTAGKIDGQL